jgi:hypothetical protein
VTPEIKRCACGRAHNREQWEQLRLVGVQPGIPAALALPCGPDLELRICGCGSTIAIEVPRG